MSAAGCHNLAEPTSDVECNVLNDTCHPTKGINEILDLAVTHARNKQLRPFIFAYQKAVMNPAIIYDKKRRNPEGLRLSKLLIYLRFWLRG